MEEKFQKTTNDTSNIITEFERERMEIKKVIENEYIQKLNIATNEADALKKENTRLVEEISELKININETDTLKNERVILINELDELKLLHNLL